MLSVAAELAGRRRSAAWPLWVVLVGGRRNGAREMGASRAPLRPTLGDDHVRDRPSAERAQALDLDGPVSVDDVTALDAVLTGRGEGGAAGCQEGQQKTKTELEAVLGAAIPGDAHAHRGQVHNESGFGQCTGEGVGVCVGGADGVERDQCGGELIGGDEEI